MTEPRAPFDALIVVGMNAEARIAARIGRVRVGVAGLDEALAGRRPAVVISFGLCGGLERGLAVGELLVGMGVVGPEGVIETDAGWSDKLAGATGARRVMFSGATAILADVAAKASQRASTGAAAADLETLAVARAARGADTPFAILRAVSDGAEDALPRAAIAGFRADGRTDLAAVLAGLARRPWELPGLVRTGLNARTAMRALSAAVARLASSGGTA